MTDIGFHCVEWLTKRFCYLSIAESLKEIQQYRRPESSWKHIYQAVKLLKLFCRLHHYIRPFAPVVLNIHFQAILRNEEWCQHRFAYAMHVEEDICHDLV